MSVADWNTGAREYLRARWLRRRNGVPSVSDIMDDPMKSKTKIDRRRFNPGTPVRSKRPKIAPVANVPAPEAPKQPDTGRVSIQDLQPHHCRWPKTEKGKPTGYCGHTRLPGLPYCEPHCARAFSNWDVRKVKPQSDETETSGKTERETA